VLSSRDRGRATARRRIVLACEFPPSSGRSLGWQSNIGADWEAKSKRAMILGSWVRSSLWSSSDGDVTRQRRNWTLISSPMLPHVAVFDLGDSAHRTEQ